MKNIKVLGTGCRNCKLLESRLMEAIESVGIEANVEKVEDIQEIVKYGIMSTPGLVIDEKIVSSGKVLSVKDIKKLIKT